MFFRLKYFFFFFCITFLFQSCALLFNSKTHTVKIYTAPNVELVKLDSSKFVYHTTGEPDYRLKRSKEHITLQFKVSDSLPYIYHLDSRLSPQYLLMNAYSPFQIGYIIDLFYNNRFMYPRMNYFSYNSKRQKIVRSGIRPHYDGKLNIKFAWNWLNASHSSLYTPFSGRASLLGLGAMADYYLSSSQSVFFESGFSRTFYFPPGKRRYYYYNSPLDSVTSEWLNNYWFLAGYSLHSGRWSIGAGLSVSPFKKYSKSLYYITYDSVKIKTHDTVTVQRLGYQKSSMVPLIKAGLCLKIGFRMSDKWSTGFNWHCYLGDVNTGKLYASHFFNFYVDFNVIELNLSRKKQRYASD